MGTKNRQRRAEKRRRREQASTPRGNRRFGQLSAREVIYAAVGALREPLHAARYQELLESLAQGPPQAAAELDAVLGEALLRAESMHWGAPEIRRQAERMLGERHAGYVSDLIEGTAGTPLVDRWAAGDGTARIDAVAGAIEVLALLLGLPPLPKPESTDRHRSADEKG